METAQSASRNLAIAPSHLVHAEIIAVTSAMRKNARWSSTSAYAFARNTSKRSGASMGIRRGDHNNDGAGSSREQPRETELMDGFENLKRTIAESQKLTDIPATTLLQPFLLLLKSPLSTGPIAATILSSLHTFFSYGLVNADSLSVSMALTDLADALSHLRFESSDPAGDEIVSLRLLAVISATMSSPVGLKLGDVEVCELLEAVLTICCQMRRGEVLRRSAEMTMHSLVRIVFSRINYLDPDVAEAELLAEDAAEKPHMDPSGPAKTKGIPAEPTSDEALPISEDTKTVTGVTASSTPTSASLTARPYGLLSIRELLRVVVNLLNPNDQAHTDSIRLTALGIITAALSVSIGSIALFPSLLSIITDLACKFLFQLIASTDTDEGSSASNARLFILERSLRVVGILLGEESMRRRMKLQQELFLSFTLDRLSPPSLPNPSSSGAPRVRLNVGKSIKSGADSNRGGSVSSPRRVISPEPSTRSSIGDDTFPVEGAGGDTESDLVPHQPRLGVLPARGETRELLMETLCHLAIRQPSFIPDLWVNYDCDLNCEDLFDKFVAFLTTGVTAPRFAGGSESHHYTSQLLCLDLLLSFVDHMARRAETPPESWNNLQTGPERMRDLKLQKKLLLTGTARFNTKPKVGLAFLEEKGLISADNEPRAVGLARFLKMSPRLDKKLLGEYISRKENTDVLKEFISLYDFRNKTVADGLRDLLESFRLPGEAQQIERITSTFAECFFKSEPVEVKSQDAVFVLAFAVIMLNTDLHSPNIRKRMTVDDFMRNLRGVNDGANFAPEYLRGIYDTIRKREIIMPQEHTGQAGFDYAWKELMNRTDIAGPLVICKTDVFDKSIFTLTWRAIVAAIADAFTTFDDETVVQNVIAGFRQCASLAAKFQLPEVFDYLVMSLASATGLLAEGRNPAAVNFPVMEVDGQQITVSPLSIKLGTSFRGQLAAVVLFTIVNGNGDAIRTGWTQIFEMFQTLFLHSLLPTRMLQSEDFLGGTSMIPLQGNAVTPVQTHGRSDVGLLSALSSYLLTPYGAPVEAAMPEVTERNIENTLSAIDCIVACRLDELYLQIMLLEVDALAAAVRALVDLANQRTRHALDFDDSEAYRYDHSARQIPYDPTSVFLLEAMVSITVQTSDKIEDLWPVVFPHFTTILSSAVRFSELLVERTVVGLLRITLILAATPGLRDQLYIALDLLNGLPGVVSNAVAEQLTAGLSLLVKDHRSVISSSTEWSLVFALIRGAASHHSAGKSAFDLVAGMATSIVQSPPARLDHLAGLIAILEEFANTPSRSLAKRPSKRSPTLEQPPLQSGTLDRGLQAIDLLYSLKNVVPVWIEQTASTRENAWRFCWTSLLVALGRQCSALSPEIRGAALGCLQRILLSPQLLPGEDVVDGPHVFYEVIFPMVDDVLSPELDERRGLREMSETRLRASTLLYKAFLQLEVGQAKVDPAALREIWMIILDFMERLMHSGGRQDQLFEAVPESLKNLILVMNASDILIPAGSENQGDPVSEHELLWTETRDRLEQFLPGLLEDLLPTPSPALIEPLSSDQIQSTAPAPAPAPAQAA